jgi:superfamily II DNA or RNA helicase
MGKIGARTLEDTMTAFYDGKIDVLISTNIVESGLDIPTANTLSRASRGHVRAGAALSIARAHRPFQAARLCLSDDAARTRS